MTDDDLLTYAQAAHYLNIRVGTLYSLVSRKEIPHVRLGKRLVRFSRHALRTLVNAKTVELAKDANAQASNRTANEVCVVPRDEPLTRRLKT